MMLKEANRTPNLRRRFFLEKIEAVTALMKRGDYLKDIHTEVFASGEMSYSQFARYVQKYIKGIAPVRRTKNSDNGLANSAIENSVNIAPQNITEPPKLYTAFLENRDEIY